MKKGNFRLRYFFVLECAFVVLFSACTFELIEFVKNNVLADQGSSDALAGIGMIAPMSLILGLFMAHLSKSLYKYISRLTNGLEQVAKGDFNIYLNKKDAGPFPDVYENFNHMVKELNSVQILRDDFINDFSHEFKTPITSINGFANLLLEEEVTDEEREKYLHIIANESNRLAELSNRTLLISKLNSQTFITDKKIYSLDEQLKNCAILLSPQWEEKKLTLTADLNEVFYNGNASLMQHVWINILNNAIKFTPNFGEIQILLQEDKSSIHVVIKDSGIGMSEYTCNNIFHKYYQGESSQQASGLGLGLSIAHRIVQLCKGTISVKSALNSGTSFDVRLPK